MNAYNANGGFAASARTAATATAVPQVVSLDRRSPFAAAAHDDSAANLHNARGLVIAVLMCAVCWAGVGLAFLL